MAVKSDIQADSILREHGNFNLIQLRFAVGQVFSPFEAATRRGRLNGPVSPDATCSRCGGPRSPRAALCRGCLQLEEMEKFASVDHYWRKLESGKESDFTLELIDLIAEMEKQVGPAAFWSKEITVCV